MVRHEAKFGTASTLVIFSRKAAGSIGANRPQRRKFALMICETPCAVSASPDPPPTKSETAIGIGWTFAWLMSTVTAAAPRGRDQGGRSSASAEATKRVGG